MDKQAIASKIIQVAAKLNIEPSWLDALINFETAGTYSPLIQNYSGSSGRGLIQVMDSTARDVFNASDSLTLVNMYPDFDSQMDNIVYPYLKRYMPFTTKQSLYMAVFFPMARYVDPATTFDSLYRKIYSDDQKYVQAYSDFSRQNHGILTVADYIGSVDRRIKPDTLSVPFAVAPLTVLLAVLGAVMLYLNRQKLF